MSNPRPDLLFSDLHVFPHSSFSNLLDTGKTSVIVEHEQTFLWIAEQVLKYEPRRVFNLGDTVHNFGEMDSLTLQAVYHGINAIRAACREVDASYRQLLGNHDFENEEKRIHCFPFISAPSLVSDIRVEEDNLFVPFYRDPEEVNARVRAILRKNKVKRAYIHLDYIGAAMNAYMVPSKKGIDASLFRGIRTYAGHYHHPQVTGSIVVVGSCNYRSFADCVLDIPRGIVLDYAGKTQRLENPHTSMYFSAKVDRAQDLDDIPVYIDPKRTYIRVTAPESVVVDLSSFHGSRVVYEKAKDAGVAPAETFKSTYDLVDRFITDNPPKELPVEYLQTYAHDLISSVLEHEESARRGVAVRIVSLHVQNFLPIGEAELFFGETGVVYVDGRIEGMEENDSNGAGKSSIFESLYWCLFNDLIREGNADDVVNTAAGKNCRVTVTFYIDDVEYIVTRSRQDEEMGDNCTLSIGGTPVSSGIEQTDERILQELGCTAAIFKHTTFLVDTLKTRFSSLNQKERVTLLESILMLDIYSSLFDACHDRLASFKKALAESQVNESGALNQLVTLDSMLSHEQDEQSAWQQRHGLEEKDIQFRIKTNEQWLPGAQQSIVLKDKLLRKLNASFFEASKALEVASYKASAASTAHSNALRQQDMLRQRNQTLTRLKKEAERTGRCAYCGSTTKTMDWSELEEAGFAIVALNSTISNLASQLEDCNQSRKLARDKYDDLENKIAAVKLDIAPLKSRVEELTKAIVNERAALERLQEVSVRSDKTVARLRRDQDKWKLELRTHQQDIFIHSSHVETYTYLESVLGPRGCRMWILRESLDRLASLAADNIDFLSRGQVRAEMGVDERGISLKAGRVLASGELTKGKYGMASGGERRKVDVGLQLGVSKLTSLNSGFRCNLMFLDEVDDKMDGASRQRLVELLDRIAVDEGKSIYIASHYKDIRTMTARTLTMLNRDGMSELLVGG